MDTKEIPKHFVSLVSFVVFVVLLLQTPRLDAQRVLSGTVHDASGALIPGVSVTAASPALSEPRTSVTDREGRYSFGDLPDGTYTLTFTLPGFVETTRADIVLPSAAGTPLDVVLRVGPPERTVILSGQGRTATCTMRVLPGDPSIDEKILKEPDATRNYAIKALPPPCRAPRVNQ